MYSLFWSQVCRGRGLLQAVAAARLRPGRAGVADGAAGDVALLAAGEVCSRAGRDGTGRLRERAITTPRLTRSEHVVTCGG